MTDKRYTALVLAASRGNQDPLAQAGGVSHKCFIDIAGEPMLRRVVKAVADSGRVKRIIVQIEPESTEEAKAILAPLGLEAITVYTPSGSSIGTSVGAVAETFPDALPLVITTGDNALHTAEMFKYFCDHLDDLKVDAGLGLTPARYVLEKYPEGNRAFHRFADGQFSSCNLYALLTPHGFEAAKVFNSGGQFGKKPKRLIGAFGLVAFLVYKSRLTKLNTFLRFLSGVLKVKTAPVVMPFAEGPIDVDRMVDWELANRIVAEREGTEVKKPGPASAPVAAVAAAPKPKPKPKAAKKPIEPKAEPEVVAAKAAEPKKVAAPKAEAAAPKPAKPAPAAKKAAAPKAEVVAPAPEPAPARPAKKTAKLAPPSAPVKTPVKKIAAPKAVKPEPAAPVAEASAPKPARKPAAKKAAPVEAAAEAPAPKPARKPAAKKADAPVETVAEAPAAKPAPARKAPAKKPAGETPAPTAKPARAKAPAKAVADAPAPAPAKKPRSKPKADQA
ncbi:NTP transferase domain-containing protein [Sphingomonas sp.]|uniref:NTP transferase domain-containing protein n=1 Tax=Sphingomonas sp. TaxID=28214 RepID=UPI001B0018B6|nr:NTP transferase domain-containing protein [Sphingomonas sp.]MBO9712274.1 NTP transferase domain-containing protein [Sphingomonas sp.]